MTRSDLDKFLDDFSIPGRKLFIYKQEFLANEYITIEKNFSLETIKEVEYKIIEDESTYIIPDFTYDLFCNLLIREELILNESGRWFTDVLSYKTGGCDAGCWATSNPNMHAFWCRKYFK